MWPRSQRRSTINKDVVYGFADRKGRTTRRHGRRTVSSNRADLSWSCRFDCRFLESTHGAELLPPGLARFLLCKFPLVSALAHARDPCALAELVLFLSVYLAPSYSASSCCRALPGQLVASQAGTSAACDSACVFQACVVAKVRRRRARGGEGPPRRAPEGSGPLCSWGPGRSRAGGRWGSRWGRWGGLGCAGPRGPPAALHRRLRIKLDASAAGGRQALRAGRMRGLQ